MYRRFLKRLLDFLISLTALLLLWPIILICMLAVRLSSPGPAIFRQRRLGFHGKEFTMLKLRTMKVNSEHTGSGVYSELKEYRPKGLLLGRATIGDAVLAIQALNKFQPQMSNRLRKFAMDIADDIQNYGTIPVYTVRRIARAANIKAETEAVQELETVLETIRSVRGSGYLQGVRDRLSAESVIVTVEKR